MREVDWEKVYGDLRKLNWLIVLIMASISYFLMSASLTLGVILGGLIIIANFSVFQHTVRAAFSSEGRMKLTKKSIIVKYYLRLLVLGTIIYTLIKYGRVDPVGLAVGLSTVVISIVILGISRALKTISGEAV